MRRSRDSDVTNSGTGKRKRRRFSCQDEDNVSRFQYRSRRDVDVTLQKNAVSSSDHANSSSTSSVNDDSISDLKADCFSESETFISVTDGFRDTSESSVVYFEEFESVSTKKKPASVAASEATSRRKPPATAVKMPCVAELEEFFYKAEKYEQKRFAKKYNYDIVKDVPIEGRYQWVRLKP